MSRIESIKHFGFHFGYQAECENGPGKAPDYPRKSEWDLVTDHLGFLNQDEKFEFVQAFLAGTKGGDCPVCGGGMHEHRHFMSVLYR